MTRRMSNRERIEHMRAEADATAKEREAAKAAKAAQPKSAKSSSSGSKSRKAAAPTPRRVRIVWSVCDQSGKEVQQFPYAQEEQARAEAQQRTTTSGRTHFVKQSDVPAD